MDKCKILVVDDESRMRKLVRDFLVKQDFEVLEAGDGEEALDIFYEVKHSGRDDAQNGRLGSLQGDPEGFEGAYYHAYGQRRRERRASGF